MKSQNEHVLYDTVLRYWLTITLLMVEEELGIVKALTVQVGYTYIQMS